MVTIQYLNPPNHLIRFTGPGGNLYFDLSNEFSLRLTNGINQLTEFSGIAQEAALTNTIKSTPKNRALLEAFEINALNPNTSSIDVLVRQGNQELNLTKLRVISFQDATNEIEVELFGLGWADELERIFLRDVDFGTFEYTKANVEASWADFTAFAVPALADYGRWLTPGDITRKDLRFKFNLWKMLKEVVCLTGYSIRSPFFEAYGGVGLYAYLSGTDWHSYRDKGSPNAAFLNAATPKTFGELFFQDAILDEVTDVDNAHDAITGIYTYPLGEPRTTIDFIFDDLEIRFYSDQIVGIYDATFNIRIERDRDGEITDIGGFEFAAKVIGEHKLTINQTESDLTGIPGDTYKIKIDFAAAFGVLAGNAFVDISAGNLNIIPRVDYYVPDDIITLQDLLDPDLNGLQLLEGMIHLCNGKIVTNEAVKEIIIYPPSPVPYINNGVIDGYFIRDEEREDLTDLIAPDSRLVDFTENNQARYIELRFADSNDAYIKEQFDDIEPFAFTVDLGFGTAKPETLKNPLFQPSIEREQLIADVGGTGLSGISLPVHWDNTSGKASTDIGFRIGYHYGLINQPAIGGSTDWSWEGGLRTLMPYITQVPEKAITNLLTPVVPITFAGYADDYYNRFYKSWISENFARFEIQFLAYLDLNQYLSMDFRKPKIIFYKGSHVNYQLVAIRDFNVGSSISTPIDVKIIKQC